MLISPYVLVLLLLFFWDTPSNQSNMEWGFFAHKKINELAIYTLPEDLIGFYKIHQNDIVKRAVNPDQRRYVIDEEGPRHYIDLDKFTKTPLPLSWNKAIEVYSLDSLEAYGVLPWNIMLYYRRLIRAMSHKDIESVVRLSADLGHYVADAHVPLHTTSNYNGQLTGQTGIHAFWESRLPELFFDQYDLFTGRAVFIADPADTIWDRIFEANDLVDSLLHLDIALTREMGKTRKYGFETKGKKQVKMVTYEFAKAYNKAFPFVELQLRRSIWLIGSLWYSAWVEAGKPTLTGLTYRSHADSTEKIRVKAILHPRPHEH